jgi:hypothetical protein
MKKKILIAVLGLASLGAFGYANTASFKLTYFAPRAQNGPSWPNSLWTVEFETMTYTRSSFQDTSFNFAYEFFLTKELSLVFSLDTFSKSRSGAFKNYLAFQLDNQIWAVSNQNAPFMDQSTFSAMHRLSISITPLQLAIKVAPLGRRIKLIPYIGAGVGLYLWSVRLQGDIVSSGEEYIYETFTGLQLPIYPVHSTDAYEGEGFGKITFGYHIFGGVMFPVANRMTVEIELKLNNAKGRLSQGFEGFDLFDIGSFQLSLGVNYWF